MFEALRNKEKKIAIVGLGYVGLPLAMGFADKLSVIGYDINEERLAKLREGIDPNGELASSQLVGKDIEFTSSADKLREASFYIIAVPTPIDQHNEPDLTPLLTATRTVASVLKKGDYVVYESTVYPGCTEEDCVPLLEEISGMVYKQDFKVGYSPERINPGDKVHTLQNTVKIVSGCDDEALSEIRQIYGLIIEAGLHQAPSIRVAEAAKIIENTQRDVNIALMNELSIIFDRMGINTYDVLEAAGTKWNFLHFYPGLVGGHCIGVDPYYLVHKAKELQYHPKMINSGRFVNDSMGRYIAKKIVKKVLGLGKNILHARVLVMGMTFKENVSDIRNSKVVDMVREFIDFGAVVDVVDPYASPAAVKQEYGIELKEQPEGVYDAIVVAVAHKDYLLLDENYFISLSAGKAVLGDIKGIFRHKIKKMEYWSL
ncbi:nucleotide sugar dehydrogenase [Parabacteroides sp. AD58]|uniref:Nucleotide sugar dehydrogenase n=1 Tax=Parabacteroides absconsus TaxID=2951805 RepID=A0ABZ2IQ48_9BACT|nr:nucleotide sugar dehydrogenase [Parabacteroides sp. AD58]MCM6903620.1 nucleotide sugar dehydrogenase [Parabacteroides sp. AD58]